MTCLVGSYAGLVPKAGTCVSVAAPRGNLDYCGSMRYLADKNFVNNTYAPSQTLIYVTIKRNILGGEESREGVLYADSYAFAV